MNERMTALKYIVQCYKCNRSLIQTKIEKKVCFPNEKTCHYAENLSLFGQFGPRSKALM